MPTAMGVTKDQVKTAMEALLAEGSKPSIRTVRNILGTGSPNTILAHMRAIETESQERQCKRTQESRFVFKSPPRPPRLTTISFTVPDPAQSDLYSAMRFLEKNGYSCVPVEKVLQEAFIEMSDDVRSRAKALGWTPADKKSKTGKAVN